MVKLLVGLKGSGKTKKLVQLANDLSETCDGSIVYISRDEYLTYDLRYQIRLVRMSEYRYIDNIDEYTGFLLGIISSDYDIEAIFIDGLLHHKDVKIPDLKEFFSRLHYISEKHELDFVVSVSADMAELSDEVLRGCLIIT